MSSHVKKNPPSQDGSTKAAVGQKRKAHQAVDESRQPAKAEKRAKQQNDAQNGLELSEINSSSNN